MDVNQYISSGILELYAAGALSPQEAAEVEKMALEHAEVQAELDAINASLAGYASAYKRNPSPGLRSEILAKIDELEDKGTQAEQKIREVSKNAAFVSAGDYARRYSKMRYLMAAVVVFLVLNIVTNFFLLYKWKITESSMVSLVNENSIMRQEYETIKETLDKKSSDMHMVMNRSNKIVDMKGMEIAPASYATVYWNPQNKQVMLNVESLPMPPADKQYQLWALKDGKPIDAGVFDMGKDPMHPMEIPIESADAFAITLEKKGGSSAPTLTQLYVMGKI